MCSTLAVLALALVAAGCGGGDDAAAVDPTAGATPPVDAGVPGATVAGAPTGTPGVTSALTDTPAEDTPGANEIAGADAAVGKTVKVSAITPKAFKKAHCSKPIMVLYYQPDAVVDSKLVKEAEAAAASIKGVVVLKYTPRDVKAAGDLPAKLGLFSTPGLATVGRDGKIENFWVTYVDRALVQLSLRNADAAKPCKVGSGDVPEAGAALADAATVASGGKLEDAPTDPLAGTEPGTPAVDAAGAAAGGGTPAVDPLTGAPIA